MKQDKEFFESIIKFANECKTQLEDKPANQPTQFECPVCGGQATGSKSSYNGHCGGSCDCGMNFTE